MVISPVLVATAFALVLPVELPDKTLLATLLLTTRYRPWPVFFGVIAAFAVQCVIAVAFGSVLTLLPDRAVSGVVAALFGVGAVVLLRAGFARTAQSDQEKPETQPEEHSRWRIALISFGVLFAAEWGDASQLVTAALTARYGAPVSVGLGSWLALVVVAAVAVLVGGSVRDRLPRRWLQRVAGLVFAGFAVLALRGAVLP